MRRGWMALAAAVALCAAERPLRPPLWEDRDDGEIPRPAERRVSELFAIVHNSWLRHLSPEYQAQRARDPGALNVNAWDEAPDSSWFGNRIGRRALTFAEILAGLAGHPPAPPPWRVTGIEDEGYTPKLYIRDSGGQRYLIKFDLPQGPERNSAAEAISTLVAHGAGYNVPHNSVVWFRAGDLRLEEKAEYRDAVGKRRRLTEADLAAGFEKLKPLGDGRYRGLASMFLAGGVGKFLYCGVRADDGNDLVPHELRRELRGLRVIASWINHVDTGDKNTLDTWEDKGKYVKHHLIDFGSTLGSGDFVNGPYRVGHEYIFDGPAMARAFFTLGIWRRPWEARGEIRYPEVGYFQAELFEPATWKPNYPNLAFERMDDADAYWGAKIVTAFGDELIGKLVEAGQYSRAEVRAYVAETLRKRRDAIGRCWLDRVTPLEDFTVEDGRLKFRDLGVERGYAEKGRRYRYSLAGAETRLPPAEERGAKPDRWGRTPLQRVRIQAERRGGGWALPVEVVLGRRAGGSTVEVLGWEHAAR